MIFFEKLKRHVICVCIQFFFRLFICMKLISMKREASIFMIAILKNQIRALHIALYNVGHSIYFLPLQKSHLPPFQCRRVPCLSCNFVPINDDDACAKFTYFPKHIQHLLWKQHTSTHTAIYTQTHQKKMCIEIEISTTK